MRKLLELLAYVGAALVVWFICEEVGSATRRLSRRFIRIASRELTDRRRVERLREWSAELEQLGPATGLFFAIDLWRAYLVAPTLRRAGADTRRAFQFAIKRATDVAFASYGIFALLPIHVLISFAIFIDSPGPIFAKLPRVGRAGKQITILKYRTMHAHSDESCESAAALQQESQVVYRQPGFRGRDHRLTRVGRVLRRFSLDETPQLLNILRGELSLVGPRPEFWTNRPQDKKAWMRNERILPGMTGLRQVQSQGGTNMESNEDLDSYYANNWSLGLDLSILGETFRSILLVRPSR